MEDTPAIRRKINVRIEGMPQYPFEEMNADKFHNDLAGFMGTLGFSPVVFYFRNVGNAVNPIKLFFEVEEQGEFAIRNLTIHNAPCTMARRFENGIVLINPSYQPFTFDLKSSFPNPGNYSKLSVSRQNTKNLDGNLEQISKHNNGKKIENLSNVKVPGLNALFLIRKD